MKGVLFTIVALFGWLAQSGAQQIDFHFQIFTGDAKIIDALQTRLIQGGPQAAETMAKVPDMVRSRRMELVDELKMQVQSGNRAKAASSNRMIEIAEDHEEVDGLALEVDPIVLEDGTLDVNLNPVFASKSGREAMVRRLSTAVTCQAGIPVMLSRWSEEDVHYIFVMTGKSAAGVSTTTNPRQMIYVDVSVFGNQADAQANREPLARMVFPSRSGQRAKMEVAEPLLYEIDGGLNYLAVGHTVEVDPVLSADGNQVELNAKIDFSAKTGGTERTADGERVPKVKILESVGTLTLSPVDSGI